MWPLDSKLLCSNLQYKDMDLPHDGSNQTAVNHNACVFRVASKQEVKVNYNRVTRNCYEYSDHLNL